MTSGDLNIRNVADEDFRCDAQQALQRQAEFL